MGSLIYPGRSSCGAEGHCPFCVSPVGSSVTPQARFPSSTLPTQPTMTCYYGPWHSTWHRLSYFLISLCLALIAPLMLYGGTDESPYLSPHPLPPPHHKRHSPYVSDSRQQLIRTLQSYTKETVSLVRDVKILDWQWYMPAVCVLCVHQISESHTSHCCLDLDSSSGAENSQWIILPGCAPHLPAAPAFTQHPGGVNLHSFRLTTPTWVWNVQKRCFQV